MICLPEFLRAFEAQWDDLKIMYAEPWSEPWVLKPGLRDDFEIYVVERGKGALAIGNRSFRVREGDAFALYSLDGNAFEPEGGFRMGLVTFSLSGNPERETARQRLIESVRASGPAFGLSEAEALLDILYRMNREMLMQTPGYRFRLKTMLARFVMLLEEAFNRGGAKTRPVDAASRRSVDMIARYLYDNADSPVALERIARHVNLNERYICTLYRRYTGKSVMEHLQEIRIGRAQRLLTHTPWTITQIAQETGYTSGQYFSRIFKRMTGMTPGQYRSSKN